MTDDELSTSDVLIDVSKNLCNLLQSNNDEDYDEAGLSTLQENLYYTETEFTDFISNVNNLTIVSVNIANLLSKLGSLKRFLNNVSLKGNKPDIVAITETHINDTTNHGYDKEGLTNIIPGYQFFHKGRKLKRGGGVGIFVSNDIKSEPKICETTGKKVRFIEEQFENIVVRIPKCIDSNSDDRKKDLVVATIYRQPNNENVGNFQDCIERLLMAIDKPNSEMVILGDMNLDLLKYENHLPTSQYLDIMTNHQTLPRIVRPTRIKNKSATLIDHIFTRDNPITLVSGIIDTELAGSCGYTDHKPVFTVLRARVPKKDRKATIVTSYFTQEGTQKRREGLRAQNWGMIIADTDPDTIYDDIVAIYGNHYHTNITKKTIKCSSKRVRREPWMTNDILADIRRRDRLAKIKDRRSDYKKLRNDIVAKIRRAERDFLHRQVQQSVGDMKKHWKILKNAINKTNNKEDITTEFLFQGQWIKDHQSNANYFNHYLANIGRETNESVGSAKLSSNHYLQKSKVRNEHSIFLSPVTAEDVLDVCKNLTPKTSMDPSGFKQSIVLQDADILAPVLAHLVNCSIEAGVCPSNSKLARVIPVYKQKGSKHLYDNYCPKLLLSTFSKII